MVKVAPSLLSADFRNMGAEIERMAAAGADYLHYDVMDGTFVPNITFGAGVLKWAAKGPLPVDAHLMTVHPETHVADFAAAGAKIITIHAEAGGHLHRTLALIREHGCLAGIALNPGHIAGLPALPAAQRRPCAGDDGQPRFGGQKMIPECLDKIAEIRAMLDRAGSKPCSRWTAGANTVTAAEMMRHGADVIVAGQRPLWRGRRQGLHRQPARLLAADPPRRKRLTHLCRLPA